MLLENTTDRVRPVETGDFRNPGLVPSAAAFQDHFKTAGKVSEPDFLDFQDCGDVYGAGTRTTLLSDNRSDLTNRMGEQSLSNYSELSESLSDKTRSLKQSKNIEPGNPDSWTLPTRENYKGWMPGDSINPVTYDKDMSLYIQEIMKDNFVVGPDGRRLSVFDLDDKEFKFRFGNAARHALAMGDLIFNHHLTPDDAQVAMFSHEPWSWFSGALESFIRQNYDAFDKNILDSGTDIFNNGYATLKAPQYKTIESFSRKMLNDAWTSAINGSGILGIPQGLK
ncbi:MAG: hypothetical protein HYX67_12895 [Candidatus Melainabacteria bacterium]|nr:hypothetical protein [Candidatus Melainabacteria bacterium]